MKLVTVGRFRNAVDAHLLRTALEADGVIAEVANEHLVGVNWLYSDAVGGVEVQVLPADAEQASATVRRSEKTPAEVASDPEPGTSACTGCGVAPPTPTRGPAGRILGAITVLGLAQLVPMLIVALPVFGRARTARCGECGRPPVAPDPAPRG